MQRKFHCLKCGYNFIETDMRRNPYHHAPCGGTFVMQWGPKYGTAYPKRQEARRMAQVKKQQKRCDTYLVIQEGEESGFICQGPDHARDTVKMLHDSHQDLSSIRVFKGYELEVKCEMSITLKE